jgi:hypothetical protein
VCLILKRRSILRLFFAQDRALLLVPLTWQYVRNLPYFALLTQDEFAENFPLLGVRRLHVAARIASVMER